MTLPPCNYDQVKIQTRPTMEKERNTAKEKNKKLLWGCDMKFQEIKQKFKGVIWQSISHVICGPPASESPGVAGGSLEQLSQDLWDWYPGICIFTSLGDDPCGL